MACNGKEDRPDPAYPSPGGRIGGADNAYGWDVGDASFDPTYTVRVFRTDTGDLMSYCAPAWVSRYTYEAIHRYMPWQVERPAISPP